MVYLGDVMVLWSSWVVYFGAVVVLWSSWVVWWFIWEMWWCCGLVGWCGGLFGRCGVCTRWQREFLRFLTDKNLAEFLLFMVFADKNLGESGNSEYFSAFYEFADKTWEGLATDSEYFSFFRISF